MLLVQVAAKDGKLRDSAIRRVKAFSILSDMGGERLGGFGGLPRDLSGQGVDPGGKDQGLGLRPPWARGLLASARPPVTGYLLLLSRSPLEGGDHGRPAAKRSWFKCLKVWVRDVRKKL